VVKVFHIQSGTKITGYSVCNPLNAELNPIYHFLTLLGAHPILHISGVRVKVLPLVTNDFQTILYFIFCRVIFVNNQLDAQFFFMYV